MHTSELLSLTAAIVPDRTATIFEAQKRTYAQVQGRANRLANALAHLGIGRGDRVAALHVNCPEHIELYFATARLDAVYVPLNFRVKSDELLYMLNDAGPKVVFVGPRYWELAESVRPRATGVRHWVALEQLHGSSPFYEALVAGSPDTERVPEAGDDDTTVLMYTAGTTGAPKGVMLTHNSFASYILANVTPADPETEERNILTVPLYHIAGLQAVMAAVYGGRTLVIQRQFEPVEWMKLVETERAHRAMMVPTMLKQLLDHPEFARHDLSSLRVITYGAAPMPVEVIKEAIRRLPHVQFINAFGQTETASTITMLPPEDHRLTGSPEEIARKLKRLSSIGKPLADVEVRIVDEEGRDVSLGQVGEIVARGPRLMKGYWGKEQATQETIRGGWLYTGDLGYFDEDGYIYLAGRAKDVIKRGGEMVSPEEVEQALQSHPAVEEAAVIGVPDAQWGERVRAIVVVKRGQRLKEEELIEYCRQRLASYKKPESVVFVKEVPRNPLGKVLKRVLREEYGQPIPSEATSGAGAGRDAPAQFPAGAGATDATRSRSRASMRSKKRK
ncbi:MAG: long-chain-fatty-acid--CoA ligase [Chloroflexi bacterium]|nr:long-chain-fatty-acid--CoA ligase [Chloroflexota bacterium]